MMKRYKITSVFVNGPTRPAALPPWAWNGLAIAVVLALAWPPSKAPALKSAFRLAFDDPSARALDLALSADGTTIASVYSHEQNRVVLQRVVKGRTATRRLDVPGPALALRFALDGRLFVAAGEKSLTVSVFGPADGKAEAVRTIAIPKIPDGLPAFSPDGRYLAMVLNGDEAIAIWDVDRSRERMTLPSLGPVRALEFSRDGRFLAAGTTRNGTVRVWDLGSRRSRTFATKEKGPVASIGFSPDGTRLAAVNRHEAALWLWDRKSGRPVRLPAADGPDRLVDSVKFSPDGSLLATMNRTGAVALRELATGKRLAHLDIGAGMPKLAFSADGRAFATISPSSNAVRVWRTRDLVGNRLRAHSAR